MPLATGLLLALSFPPLDLSFLVWIALIPLFVFLNLAPSKASAWKGSFASGFIFFGFLLKWFFDAWPLNWVGLPLNYITFLIVLLVWVLTVSVMASLFAFFGLFVYKTKFSLASLFPIAGAWTVLEYLRSWFFILPWLDQQTALGPHWSFGALGYALHNQTYFLKFAPWIGVYGLGFIIVLVSSCLYLLPKLYRNHLHGIKYGFCLFIITAVLFGPLIVEKPKLDITGTKNIALIQTNFRSFVGFGLGNTEPIITSLVKESLRYDPNIIVLPEGSSWIKSLTDNLTEKPEVVLPKILGEGGYLVLDHARVRDGENFKSRLFYFLNPLGVVDYYDKELLVPGGEYLPYLVRFFAKMTGQEEFNEAFTNQRGLKQGNEEFSGYVDIDGLRLGGSICSGIISPKLNRIMTKKDVGLLITVSSDAIFKGSKFLIKQNLAMSKVRAAENNRYFVQVTNGGLSYVINENGRVENMTKNLGDEVLIGKAKLFSGQTFYTKNGDLINYISLILIVIYGVYKTIKRRSTSGG